MDPFQFSFQHPPQSNFLLFDFNIKLIVFLLFKLPSIKLHETVSFLREKKWQEHKSKWFDENQHLVRSWLDCVDGEECVGAQSNPHKELPALSWDAADQCWVINLPMKICRRLFLPRIGQKTSLKRLFLSWQKCWMINKWAYWQFVKVQNIQMPPKWGILFK